MRDVHTHTVCETTIQGWVCVCVLFSWSASTYSLVIFLLFSSFSSERDVEKSFLLLFSVCKTFSRDFLSLFLSPHLPHFILSHLENHLQIKTNGRKQIRLFGSIVGSILSWVSPGQFGGKMENSLILNSCLAVARLFHRQLLRIVECLKSLGVGEDKRMIFFLPAEETLLHARTSLFSLCFLWNEFLKSFNRKKLTYTNALLPPLKKRERGGGFLFFESVGG